MKRGGQEILDALLDLPGKYGWDHMNSFMAICDMATYARSKDLFLWMIGVQKQIIA